jgi:hypothetical protein
LKIPSSPEDPGFAGPVAPDALNQINAWAVTKLGAHPAP